MNETSVVFLLHGDLLGFLSAPLVFQVLPTFSFRFFTMSHGFYGQQMSQGESEQLPTGNKHHGHLGTYITGMPLLQKIS